MNIDIRVITDKEGFVPLEASVAMWSYVSQVIGCKSNGNSNPVSVDLNVLRQAPWQVNILGHSNGNMALLASHIMKSRNSGV
jgi:hypothetical protein